MLRYHEIAQDERKVLALTSFTPREFAELLPIFTTCFSEYLEDQTVEGDERVGRGYIAYRNSPLPTMEDKLLFILVYLKQAPTQEVQGCLFGLRQSHANTWIHLLHPVVNQALARLGDLPKRDIVIDIAEIMTEDTDSVRETAEMHEIRETDERKDPPRIMNLLVPGWW
jgi:Helix-turn-helix of DDE superfamily endonuclease